MSQKIPDKTNSTSPEMNIIVHLQELRVRLFKAFIALTITTAISFAFGDRVIQLLVTAVGGLEKVQSIEVTENISVFMRVSLLSGFILAFPYVLFQVLAFIMPGLKASEKRYVLLFIPFATLLFLSGVAFAYFVMLPAAVPFLVTFMGIPTTPRLANYINFVTNMMFWIGIAFEMPLLVFLLAKLNFINAGQLVKGWRFAVVIIAILAAVISPTVDPINMALLMAPLLVLYVISIFMAMLARGRDEKKKPNKKRKKKKQKTA